MKSSNTLKWLLSGVKFILITALCATAGCVFHDSAKTTISKLEEAYGTELEFVKDEIEVMKGNYVLRDLKRGFNFSAGSVMVSNRHFPGKHKETYSNYFIDLMRHHHQQAMDIAARYQVRFEPPLLGEPTVDMDSETYGRHLFANDNVYIHSVTELEQAVQLFMHLSNLYKFEYYENKTFISPYIPKMSVYYLPEGETDSSKKVYIYYCDYLLWDIPYNPDLESSQQKRRYYTPSEHEIRTELFKRWNYEVEKGKIPQK